MAGFMDGHAWMVMSMDRTGRAGGTQEDRIEQGKKDNMQMDGRTDWQTDRQTEADRWRDRHMDAWIDEKANNQQGMHKQKK